MVYTTHELIDILEKELKANWQGKRILFSSAKRIDNPVLAKAINLEKANRVFAYQDFRRQVHEYQREHHISGIVWRLCEFQGQSIQVPELHNQLVLVPGDKLILMEAKESILAFWYRVTVNMNYFLTGDRLQCLEGSFESITPSRLSQVISKAEWVEIDAGHRELYLRLCWGNPEESQYLWAYPHSGCERVIATKNTPSPINLY